MGKKGHDRVSHKLKHLQGIVPAQADGGDKQVQDAGRNASSTWHVSEFIVYRIIAHDSDPTKVRRTPIGGIWK